MLSDARLTCSRRLGLSGCCFGAEWQLPAFLRDPKNYDDATPDRIDHQHKVIFEVCSHEKEARCEHLAFQLALQHGQCAEPDVPKQDILAQCAQTTIGNMAWGNGSTQGLPDGKSVVKAPMGLNKVKKILEGVLGLPDGAKKFKPSSECTEAFKQVKAQIAQELNVSYGCACHCVGFGAPALQFVFTKPAMSPHHAHLHAF